MVEVWEIGKIGSNSILLISNNYVINGDYYIRRSENNDRLFIDFDNNETKETEARLLGTVDMNDRDYNEVIEEFLESKNSYWNFDNNNCQYKVVGYKGPEVFEGPFTLSYAYTCLYLPE